MRLYSVLLVDDEEDAVQVIMKKINWESMGFRIAGYAGNGIEALEMAEKAQPDVVMTNIRMPYMDGLSLSRKLKELYPNIRIIIFSGFDDFEYAREAIQIEVEAYVLKPINSSELKKIFENVKEDIDKERDEKQNIDKLQKYYMESLPVLRENFYTLLIEGRVPADRMEQYFKEYQVQMSGPYYIVTVLHVSDLSGEMEPYLTAVSVKKLAEEHVREKWDCRIFSYLGEIIIITQLSEKREVTDYTDYMDRFCKMARRVCRAEVTAGIGRVCDEIKDIPISYKGAADAVSYRVILGNTRAINITEVNPKNADESWEERAVRQLFKMIRTGDRQSLEKAVSECVRKLFGRETSLQKYRLLIMEIITELFRFGSDNQLKTEQIFGQNEDVYGEIMRMESVEAVQTWLMAVSARMQDMILADRTNTTKSFVKRAAEYVKEHYSDQELSVEVVCKALGVSTSYFSTVFKRETGKTFVKYLTEFRIEKAAELLLTKEEKTYLIAQKAGYSDPNYFSYVFKRQFGVPPSKYRSWILKKKNGA